MSAAPNFDRVARPYRWLEYMTLGRALERCRMHFLPQLGACTNALVIGDGDGRFLAELMAHNGALKATVVDASASMLRLLEQRCMPYADRLVVQRTDALNFQPEATCDLICTHFFLDCLTQRQVDELAMRLASSLHPANGRWLISDFRIPPVGLMRFVGGLIVTALYFAFGMLTGMKVRRLPDHAAALARAGLHCTTRHLSLNGLLVTELWSHSHRATDV